MYYKEAAGALIVFDVGRRRTLDGARKWLDDIRGKVELPGADGGAAIPIPVALLANKSDLADTAREVSREDGAAIADELNIAYFETSAKDNLNIANAVEALVAEILEVGEAAKLQRSKDRQRVALHDKVASDGRVCC